MVTFWERADLLALLSVMFPCVFVTFPYGQPGQVCELIVSVSVSVANLWRPAYLCRTFLIHRALDANE